MEKQEQFNEWLTLVEKASLPRWEELPDLFLYKDQVVSLVTKYLQPYAMEENQLTPSMINNYVKLNIVPKPNKKKQYDKRQLAFLIAISLLKTVLPIGQIQRAMEIQISIDGEKQAYNSFCQQFEDAVHFLVNQYRKQPTDLSQTPQNLLFYGCYALANKIFAVKVINLYSQTE